MSRDPTPIRRRRPRDPLAALWQERERRIRVEAYFRSERRGFPPGHEIDDWLAAERAVDAETRYASQE